VRVRYGSNPTKSKVGREDSFSINTESSSRTIPLHHLLSTTTVTSTRTIDRGNNKINTSRIQDNKAKTKLDSGARGNVRCNTEFRVVHLFFLFCLVGTHGGFSVELFEPGDLFDIRVFRFLQCLCTSYLHISILHNTI
jgi:hypothetical protein